MPRLAANMGVPTRRSSASLFCTDPRAQLIAHVHDAITDIMQSLERKLPCRSARPKRALASRPPSAEWNDVPPKGKYSSYEMIAPRSSASTSTNSKFSFT
jgi:hypothetical protein